MSRADVLTVSDLPAHGWHAVVTLPAFQAQYASAPARLQARYCSIGNINLPPVVVLGGISAHAAVATLPDGTPGWWDAQVGPGRGIDTRRFRVIGVDYITSSCLPDVACSTITTTDQATVLAAVLDALHIPHLHALIGASYGAMVGLVFAARYADRLAHLIAISGAHQAHPFATALRSIQRQIIHLAAPADTRTGVALARALALASYLSPELFAKRFAGRPRHTAHGWQFPVEDYLAHNGQTYAAQVTPQEYLQLSESLDLHYVNPATIATPTTLIAATPDLLVPVSQLYALAEQLAGPCRVHTVPSPHGHDAFLQEHARFRVLLNAALEEPYEP